MSLATMAEMSATLPSLTALQSSLCSTTYGKHLTLRISDLEPPDALDSEADVRDFLKELVHHIGMRVLAGPLVGYEDGEPEKRGTSGVVILYESHAAIHTYPELGQLFLDVFSCKEFSVQDVHDVLHRHYGSYHVMEEHVQDRGIHWGPDVIAESHNWATSR